MPNPSSARPPKLTLPDGFVRFYQQDDRVFAIDRGQVVIKVTRQPNDEDTAYMVTGHRPAGDNPLGYFVGLAASDKNVFLVEAWGPAEEVEGQRDALIDALKTLRVNRGWW